jgi:hypothetical protein
MLEHMEHRVEEDAPWPTFLAGRAPYRAVRSFCVSRSRLRKAAERLSVRSRGAPPSLRQGDEALYRRARHGRARSRIGKPEVLLGATSGMPGTTTISAGSLDDPGVFQPQFVCYTSRGHAWDLVDPALRSFANMPPMTSDAEQPARNT